MPDALPVSHQQCQTLKGISFTKYSAAKSDQRNLLINSCIHTIWQWCDYIMQTIWYKITTYEVSTDNKWEVTPAPAILSVWAVTFLL